MAPVIRITKDSEGVLQMECSEGQGGVAWSLSDSLKSQLISEIKGVKEGEETADSKELLESVQEMLSSALPADYYDQ